jgi:hypothetical protein
MKINLTSIVSVIRDYMTAKPAGIIIMYMERVFGFKAEEKRDRLILVPVRVKSK